DRQELERTNPLQRHNVMGHAELARERGTVAPVPVEQLDDARRRSGGANALLDPLAVDGIDHPHLSAGDERVRTALHELVLDPAEAGVELVYRFHIAAQRSWATSPSETIRSALRRSR